MFDEDSDCKPCDGKEEEEDEEEEEEEERDVDDPLWKAMPNSLIVANRTLACGICGRQGFKRPYLLKRHMKTHTGEKPFSCDTCGKKFTQQSDVKRHMRTHPLEEPQTCAICNCTFLKFSEFERHTKLHANPCKCELCDRTFTQMSDLKRHVRLHTGEKPFSCDMCEKKFTQSYSLRQHMRLHTGERPYNCEMCNMEFRTSSERVRHMEKHGSKSTFKCGICNKAFVLVNNLVEHMRIHNGETSFKCDVCDKVFPRAWTLEKHTKVHTMQKCEKSLPTPQQTVTHFTQAIDNQILHSTRSQTIPSLPNSVQLLDINEKLNSGTIPNLPGEGQIPEGQSGLSVVTVDGSPAQPQTLLHPLTQFTGAILSPAQLRTGDNKTAIVSENPVMPAASHIMVQAISIGKSAASMCLINETKDSPQLVLKCSLSSEMVPLVSTDSKVMEALHDTVMIDGCPGDPTVQPDSHTVESDCKPEAIPVSIEMDTDLQTGCTSEPKSSNTLEHEQVFVLQESSHQLQNQVCLSPRKLSTEDGEVKLEGMEPEMQNNQLCDKASLSDEISTAVDGWLSTERLHETQATTDGTGIGEENICDTAVQSENVNISEWKNMYDRTSCKLGLNAEATMKNDLNINLVGLVTESTVSHHSMEVQTETLPRVKDNDNLTSSVVSLGPTTGSNEVACETSTPTEIDRGAVANSESGITRHQRKNIEGGNCAQSCSSDVTDGQSPLNSCSSSQQLNTPTIKGDDADVKNSFSTPQQMLQQFCSMTMPINSPGKWDRGIPPKWKQTYPSFGMSSPFPSLVSDVDSDTELATPQQILTQFLPKMGQKSMKNSCDKLLPVKIPELNSDKVKVKKTYQCDVCHKKLKTFFTWKEHLSIHTSERPWRCEICGKSYRLESYVKKHMLTHTAEDDKAFICSICGKKFATADYLKQHMRVHTGEKLFKCKVCEKSFATSNYLKIHKSIHTGEKNLNCGVCMRSFRHPTDLKRHVQGHLRDLDQFSGTNSVSNGAGDY